MASSSARLFLLFAFCVLPALVAAKTLGNPFLVTGQVYCDTCRCGFETPATTYIPGATVRIECRDGDSLRLVYSVGGVTDSTGTYNILVEDDHEDEICECVLVHSPLANCKIADKGRNRVNIILTRFNGVLNDNRFANSMGFLIDQRLPECGQVLQKYPGYELSL